MIGQLLTLAVGMFGMYRPWLPLLRYQAPFPAERPGKSGVAAARRAARKQRRAR